MKKMYSLLTFKQGVLLFVGAFVFLLSHQAKAQCPGIQFPNGQTAAICHNTELQLSNYFQLTDTDDIVGYTWTTSGSGNFYPTNYLVTTSSLIYAPSVNDILAGSVTLTVEIIPDPALTGCTTITETFDLTIHPDPKVDFTWTGGSCIDELITFTAVSNATPPVTFNNVDCRWDFPDGQTYTGVTVSKAFTYPGEHLVKLTVTANGCAMPPVSKNVSIKSKPIAVFTFDKPSCPDDEVLFNDFSYAPAGSQIVLREWDFEGDGVVDETHTVSAPTVSHIYGAAGTFNPTLRVVTNDGCEAIFSSEIIIKEAPLAEFTVTGGFCMGSPIQFECTTVIPVGGSPIVSYHWNFGDPMSGANNTSTLAAPQHIFTTAGNYEVKLVITNAEGCSDEEIQNITIESVTNIQIQPDVAEPYCAGQTIEFSINATGLTNYQWSVNGTLESSQPVFSHYFYGAGYYTVSVSAEEANGCRSTASYIVHIHDKPLVGFTTSSPVCLESPVLFTNTSNSNDGGIVTWVWDFGDGNTQTVNLPDLPNVEHSYSGTGKFMASLEVTTEYGCVASITQEVEVLAAPNTVFALPNPAVGCVGESITFTNLTQPHGSYMLYEWTFTGPEVLTASAQNPSVIFNQQGRYDVSLTATNTQTGCQSTYPTRTDPPMTINITEAITATITTGYPTNVCVGETVTFNGTANVSNAILKWSLGNGTPIGNPYTFNTPGIYTVVLVATDANGNCQSAPVSTAAITVHAMPSSDFTANVPSCSNEPVEFTYIGDANYNDIVSWIWNFGDGETQTVTPPMSPNVSHTYSGLGPYTVTLTTKTSSNCESITQSSVALNQPSVIAAFSVPALTVCAGNDVFFQNQTTYTPTTASMTWSWTVTDQATGAAVAQNSNQDFTHIFANSGSYSISLLATNTTTGCQDLYPKTGAAPIIIQVIDQPVASFTVSPSNEVCHGTPITFAAEPAGSILTWDFGDGTTAPNPHIYEIAGTYVVTLIASTSNGTCASEPVSQMVTVRPTPVSNFEHNAPVCQGDEVVFTSTTQSIDPIATYLWDFGEGPAVDGSATEVFSYSGSGTFQAKLTTETAFGCSNVSPTIPVQINIAPTAGFTWSGSCAGSEITFSADGSFSNDPNNPIESYEWMFDDGIVRYGHTITRLDMEERTYAVTLIVRNANTLCQTSITKNDVIITEAVNYDITVDEELYVEPFTYKKCLHTGVLFAFEQSSGDDIVSFTWNFGDGTPVISNLNPITHVYETAGNYTTTLTIYTEKGCQRSTSFNVNVGNAPTAHFTTVNLSCIDQEILFVDHSLPGSNDIDNYITRLTWDFNDGTGLHEGDLSNRNITHQFAIPNTYNVVLEVEDNFGCTATYESQINVISNAEANFRYDTACFSESFHFYDMSTPNSGSHIVAWAWDFGDIGNTTSILQNPTHQFSAPGEYEVELVITNEIGCVDTITKMITVDPCFKALFSLENEINICAETEVLFYNESEISTEVTFVSYRWDWGDGEYSTYQDAGMRIVPHTYTNKQGGEYIVNLELKVEIDGKIYTSNYQQTLIINPLPTAILENISVCYNNEVTIMDQSLSNSIDESMPITTWEWTFGANSPITQYQSGITYLFDNKEVQNVQLKVSNEIGCSSITTAQITYKDSPIINFTVSDSCARENFQFEVIVENEIPITSYQWNFGDGTSEQLFEPYATHYFANEGTYEVTLMVESIGGCYTEKTEQVIVYPLPFVDFRYTENVNGQQGNCQFENLSQNAILYNWIFNATDTLTETNPLYLFGTDSPNIVELIAWNQHGCYASKVDSIMGLTFYGLYFPNAFLPDSENPEINRFTGKGVNLIEYRLEVFSNWGQLLWSSEKLEDGSPSETWDGTYDGEKVPMGSYVWRATAKFVDGSVWNGSDNGDGNTKKFGIINLIR